ncbi:MAG TPA: hypothetical protein VKP69_21000, partial [Isosphaeraceae bacterium]|nr:hypothetical protein [Isosphaeraceae bacterium]
AQIPAVGTLRRVWAEQYTDDRGQLRWREVKEMPSPADLYFKRPGLEVAQKVWKLRVRSEAMAALCFPSTPSKHPTIASRNRAKSSALPF